MNLLTDALPEAIMCDGGVFPVHTDFRNWIQFEQTVFDEKMEEEKRLVRMLELCYKQTLPPSLQLALEEAVRFYAGGETARSEKKTLDTSGTKDSIYSFEYDADYIYSAFYTQYGIDLTSASLHWYQFKALFRSLNDTNQIVKIMEYRSMDLSKIKDKEQRSFYRKMKKLYELPHSQTETEKINQIEEALLNGGDLSGLLE